MLKNSAFSMVELAIVIVVIGLLMSGTFEASKYFLLQNQIKSTNIKLNAIQNALEIYAMENGKLPCPAGLKKDDGKSASSCTTNNTANGIYVNNSVATGAVPYIDLNLTKDIANDAWNGKILYSVNTTTTTTSTSTNSTSGITKLIPTQVRIKVYDNANATDNLISDTVVYTLVSNGKNKFGAFDSKRNSQLSSSGAKTAESTNLATYSAQNVKIFISDDSYGDDIVRYKTRMQLLHDAKIENIFCYITTTIVNQLKTDNNISATFSLPSTYIPYNHEIEDSSNEYKIKCFKYGRLGIFKYDD